MTLPNDRSELTFADFKPPYTPDQARVEANRCLFCHDAPCVKACPTHIDIPGFIRKIATENLRGSARTILDSNILGMSCARVCPVEVLCVGDCVYNEMGVPPIQIGKLQRFATDLAFERGWQFFEAGPDTGKSVGVVGGGPAGLAAAHRLRRFGHRVTIYDRRPVLGGLNTTGVAPYKMRADRSLEEIDYVLAIGGIDLRLGVEVGTDLPWDALVAAHDALFIGIGLGPDTILDLPGAHLERVIGAVEWIEQMKTHRVSVDGIDTAVVLGGGNTAIDVVRELLGLGVPNVELVYRGTEDGMPGYAHEWRAAKEAGARGRWQLAPVGFEGAGTDLTGVQVVRVDAQKRPISGSETVIEADLVVLAVGQSKLAKMVDALHLRTERGRIAVDARGATSQPFVFAGGDAANGGKEVVNAVAEGRDAAVAIHEYLTQTEAR